MQYIIYVLFLTVSVIGLAEILHNVHLFLTTKKCKNSKVLFCRLEETFPDLQLRFLAEQKNWHGSGYADRIIAFCDFSDEALIAKCIDIARRQDILLICRQEVKNSTISES